ncbi:hypothetical protein [Streptomonospora salina]|uniref:Uncharacterized protein n=1 Tax=Streptomonospora salina TaxID=104205 RepID=A0A841EAZ8_9ACTN|nr:hypothetical protein [Streptomonospora salina]MBB6000182.1 hypothetical protein [Streptomonospora salina]
MSDGQPSTTSECTSTTSASREALVSIGSSSPPRPDEASHATSHTMVAVTVSVAPGRFLDDNV